MDQHIPDDDSYGGSDTEPDSQYSTGPEDPAGSDQVEAWQGKPLGGREMGPNHTDQNGPGYDW